MPGVQVRDRSLAIVVRPVPRAIVRTEGDRRIVVRGRTRLVVAPAPTPIAVRGFVGPPGPPGQDGQDGSGVANYTHDQSVPAAVWTIPHNLGFRPAGVRVEDTLGRDVLGLVSYPDVNTVVLTFNAAFSGTAYVS